MKERKRSRPKRWRCTICNMVFEEAPPDLCPVCGAGRLRLWKRPPKPTRRERGHRRGVRDYRLRRGPAAGGKNHTCRRNARASVTPCYAERRTSHNRPALSDVLAGEMTYDQALLDTEAGLPGLKSRSYMTKRRRWTARRNGFLWRRRRAFLRQAAARHRRERVLPIPQKEGGLPVRTLRTKGRRGRDRPAHRRLPDRGGARRRHSRH